MKNSFVAILMGKYTRIANSLSLEERYRFYVYIIFSSILLPIFIGFSIYLFFRGENIRAMMDVVISVCILLSLFLIFSIQNKSALFLVNFSIVFGMLVYLFMCGFANGASIIWMFPLPATALFLFGIKKGYLFIGISYIFFLITFVGLDIFPFKIHFYSRDIIIRFLISYSSIVILAHIYEKLRQMFQNELEGKRKELFREKEELKQALENIKTLTGLLPICAHCKNVRDDSGYWHRVESYIEKHSDALFSHGICPDCLQKYHPESSRSVD